MFWPAGGTVRGGGSSGDLDEDLYVARPSEGRPAPAASTLRRNGDALSSIDEAPPRAGPPCGLGAGGGRGRSLDRATQDRCQRMHPSGCLPPHAEGGAALRDLAMRPVRCGCGGHAASPLFGGQPQQRPSAAISAGRCWRRSLDGAATVDLHIILLPCLRGDSFRALALRSVRRGRGSHRAAPLAGGDATAGGKTADGKTAQGSLRAYPSPRPASRTSTPRIACRRSGRRRGRGRRRRGPAGTI